MLVPGQLIGLGGLGAGLPDLGYHQAGTLGREQHQRLPHRRQRHPGPLGGLLRRRAQLRVHAGIQEPGPVCVVADQAGFGGVPGGLVVGLFSPTLIYVGAFATVLGGPLASLK